MYFYVCSFQVHLVVRKSLFVVDLLLCILRYVGLHCIDYLLFLPYIQTPEISGGV